MGERGSFGGSYIGMLAQNALTIMQSYQCMGAAVEIPAWPPEPAATAARMTCGTPIVMPEYSHKRTHVGATDQVARL